jgi:hypothetical protein
MRPSSAGAGTSSSLLCICGAVIEVRSRHQIGFTCEYHNQGHYPLVALAVEQVAYTSSASIMSGSQAGKNTHEAALAPALPAALDDVESLAPLHASQAREKVRTRLRWSWKQQHCRQRPFKTITGYKRCLILKVRRAEQKCLTGWHYRRQHQQTD